VSAEDDESRPRFPKRVTLKWDAPPLLLPGERLPGEPLPGEHLPDEHLPGEGAPLPYSSDEDNTAELQLPEPRPPERPSAPPPGLERHEGVDAWERQGPRLTPPPFRPLSIAAPLPLLDGEAGGALDLVDRRSRPRTPTPELAVEMSDRYALGDYTAALSLAELILGRDPADATAERVAMSSRARLGQLYRSRLGSLARVPRVAVDASEMRWLGLDHRAAFLLSRVDGEQSLADLVDVSGMPALEALKTLVELLDLGALELTK
jgi:hypothetical protein